MSPAVFARRCHLFQKGLDNGVVVTEDQIEPVRILRDASDAV
jgi:hypothetical protein